MNDHRLYKKLYDFMFHIFLSFVYWPGPGILGLFFFLNLSSYNFLINLTLETKGLPFSSSDPSSKSLCKLYDPGPIY